MTEHIGIAMKLIGRRLDVMRLCQHFGHDYKRAIRPYVAAVRGLMDDRGISPVRAGQVLAEDMEKHRTMGINMAIVAGVEVALEEEGTADAAT